MKQKSIRVLAILLMILLALPVCALSEANDIEAEYAVTVLPGVGGTATATPASGPSGAEVRLTATPDSGYRFVQWEVVSGGVSVIDDHFIIGMADVQVRPVFERITHTLTIRYVYENGNEAAEPYVAELAEGTPYDVDSPVIEGYAPDRERITGVMGDADIACEVIYASRTYRITFKANGGSGKMGAQIVNRGVKTALKKNRFTRANYSFKGWNTRKNGSGKSYKDKAQVRLTRDTVLYAQWVKQKVKLSVKSKITFKPNAKKLTVTAKLRIDKKPAKKKKLTLKVKGKTFTAKTNAKGVARFTIKRKFLNKAGKYKYTVKYGKTTASGTIIVKK